MAERGYAYDNMVNTRKEKMQEALATIRQSAEELKARAVAEYERVTKEIDESSELLMEQADNYMKEEEMEVRRLMAEGKDLPEGFPMPEELHLIPGGFINQPHFKIARIKFGPSIKIHSTDAHRILTVPFKLIEKIYDAAYFGDLSAFACSTDGVYIKAAGDDDSEENVKKVLDRKAMRCCIARGYLFITSGPCATVSRFSIDTSGDEPKLVEDGSFNVRGGKILTGVATLDFLAVCDMGMQRVTIHKIENGAQVDVILKQEMSKDFQPIEAAWLDSDRLCVAGNTEMIHWGIYCMSLSHKEVLWRLDDLEVPIYFSAACNRVYLAYFHECISRVRHGDTGELVPEEELKCEVELPLKVYEKGGKMVACSADKPFKKRNQRPKAEEGPKEEGSKTSNQAPALEPKEKSTEDKQQDSNQTDSQE